MVTNNMFMAPDNKMVSALAISNGYYEHFHGSSNAISTNTKHKVQFPETPFSNSKKDQIVVHRTQDPTDVGAQKTFNIHNAYGLQNMQNYRKMS